MWLYHDASEFILPMSTVVAGSLADSKLWFFVLEGKTCEGKFKCLRIMTDCCWGCWWVPLLSELKEQFPPVNSRTNCKWYISLSKVDQFTPDWKRNASDHYVAIRACSHLTTTTYFCRQNFFFWPHKIYVSLSSSVGWSLIMYNLYTGYNNYTLYTSYNHLSSKEEHEMKII